MPRPRKCRKVCKLPPATKFNVHGCEEADYVVLTVDEYECIRLVDYQGFSQEQCAEYMQVSTDLANGMTLVIFANREDIRQIRYDIEFKISLTVILLAVLFILIVCFMVKRIVSPLKKLTDASIQLARGDYDIEITPSNTREIQLLSTAFENMAMNLREHEKLQHLLAYRDPLTGLRNTNSYKDWVNDFNKKIKTQDSAFGVVMLDLNYLKEANDTYGHNVGNTLIVSTARMISDAFKRSPVFRIGGDEFVVILQNRDLEEREALFTKFETDCESTVIEADDITLPISIAKGFSLFDPTTDTEFSDVFDRADEEMYANKKAMKMAQKQ